MNNEAASGEWLPILEYAMKHGVSISTLRRRIRSNQISFRLEKGKYLILEDERDHHGSDTNGFDLEGKIEARVSQLECELQKAQEEIAELKMLMALYEEKIPQRSNA